MGFEIDLFDRNVGKQICVTYKVSKTSEFKSFQYHANNDL